MNQLIIREAAKLIGLKEIPGEDQNNQEILELARELNLLWIKTDEVPWCLTGDMEVLTSDGFIRFDQFKNVRQVAQVTTDHKVEFVNEFAFIKKKYKGKLYNIRKKSMDISCDPNHEFYGRWSATGPYKKRKISTVTKYGVAIPPIESSKEDFPISDRDLLLLGAFLSDGHKAHNRIIIGVSKERKIAALSQLGPEWERDYNVIYEGKKQRRTYSFVYPEQFHVCLDEYKILNWDFVRSLSARQCKLFIDNYALYDGTPEQGAFTVFTISEKLSESLGYIATMAGYRSSWYKTKQVSANCNAEYLYNVYVSINNKHKFIQRKDVSESDFNGFLYCLTVPSGVMVIRDRNKNIYPIGNCAVGLNAVLKRVGAPYKSTARALDMLDYGIPVPAGEEMPGDIAVFVRVGGGHNSFYLGHHSVKKAIWVMGGNQRNEWNISLYSTENLKAIRRAIETTEMLIPDSPLKSGSTGKAVIQLQQILLYEGFYKSKVDGIYGDGTASAVMAFQNKHGLQGTGQYDQKMKNKIFSLLNE